MIEILDLYLNSQNHSDKVGHLRFVDPMTYRIYLKLSLLPSWLPCNESTTTKYLFFIFFFLSLVLGAMEAKVNKSIFLAAMTQNCKQVIATPCLIQSGSIRILHSKRKLCILGEK